MGVLELCVTLMPGKGRLKELVRMTGWKLMEEAKIPPPFDECPTPHPLLNHEYFSLEFQGGSKAYLSKSCEGSGAKS